MNINTFNEKANEKTKLNEGIVTFLKEKGLVWEIDGTDKQVLTKGGAELLADVFELDVRISNPETKTVVISGHSYEYVYVVAEVHDQKNNIIGKGVGGRSLYEDGYNLNTTLKMAAKSAYVDSVIRALKLSSALTQDGVSEPVIPVSGHNQTSTQSNDQTAAEAVQQAKEADTKERVDLMNRIVTEAGEKVSELVTMFGASKIEEIDTASLRKMLEMIRTSKAAIQKAAQQAQQHEHEQAQPAKSEVIPEGFVPDQTMAGNTDFQML